ncbi:MAG: tyrosine-protein phosphatase [Solobacterium sp.]|nr:tyrosine-protein phosphatase [Solobacterium sp.]
MSRRLGLNGLNNTRDLGGMKTIDGHVIRSGMLYRSGHLFSADEADRELLSSLIDSVVDFRTSKERSEKPDPELAAVSYYHLPVFDGPAAGITREGESDEFLLEHMLEHPDKARERMCLMYRNIATSDTAATAYTSFLNLLAEPHEKGVLWHCTAGKDRAGFGSVLIERILGVSQEDVMRDYLATNEYLREEIAPLKAMILKQAGVTGEKAAKAVDYLFGAEPDYLKALFDSIDETYGSFEAYLQDRLHCSTEAQSELRYRYLEEA